MLNELSTVPLSENKNAANEKMILFSEAFSRAREFGFRKIRTHLFVNQIMLFNEYSLHDWLNSNAVPRRYRDYLYGALIHPFIKDEDIEVVENFVMSNYFFENLEVPVPRVQCFGLASAYLYDTLSISFQSIPLWSERELPIIVENNGTERIERVRNIAAASAFNDNGIITHVENISEVHLVATAILPDNKEIHISDHHGKAEVMALCDQLKLHDYVVAMRSTKWGGQRFIRKANRDGTIEIVLYKTARRYALLVQTTGRNYRETKAIADILEERFS